MGIVDTAKAIAFAAHAGQTRKDGKTPYIHHPADVARRLAGEDDSVIATAWLHDVLEDSAVSEENLISQGMPLEVVEAVAVLTKAKGLCYQDYLKSVADSAVAKKVKIADILSNLSDDPSERAVVKYAKALLFLYTEDGE